MGLVLKLFRDEVKKSKSYDLEDATFDVSYPTGFLALDFLNGSMVKINGGKEKYYSVGIVDGTSTTLIGRPGCGKTTLAVEIAANILKSFPDADLYYDDIEGGSNGTRRQTLMLLNDDEIADRVHYRNSGITAENFFESIDKIYRLKTTHREELLYDTGFVDPTGQPIFKLVPTVYILDSLAMLTPDKLSEEEELSGQMSATAMAKTNTQVYKRIIPKLKAANIILLVINHINDDVNINPMQRKKSQVSWLKQGEYLPGGKAAIYLANNMFRLDDNTKLKESEGMGVYGTVVDVSIIKSRTNASGRSIPLVLDYYSGFDPELSLLLFLKGTNDVVAKGAYMSLVDYPDLKFTQKGFKEKLYTDPEFSKAFQTVCARALKGLILEKEMEEDEVANSRSFSSSMLEMMQKIE